MESRQTRIRVLFVVLSLEIGGMEQVVAELVLGVDKRRFEVAVVCLADTGPIADELASRGVTIIRLGRMIPVWSYLYPSRLVKVIRAFRPDVVHAHSGCWHKAALAGFLAGVQNILYTEHGRIGFYAAAESRIIICLDRLYSAFTTCVVCVSRDLAEYMVKVVGIRPGKVTCIVNGIDDSRFAEVAASAGMSAYRLGIVARLAPVKDVATLLHAVQILRQEGRPATLSVVGDGPERANLETLAADLGIGDAVTFSGFRRDIAAVFSEIDIFVLSSISEGTSITLLEAMAAGKPVIATNVGGNPAIVEDGVNGLLVPPGNPAAMAKAVAKMMDDREMRERMREANPRTVRERYSVRSMTAAYENLYSGLRW